jgi:hypothetical protein
VEASAHDPPVLGERFLVRLVSDLHEKREGVELPSRDRQSFEP